MIAIVHVLSHCHCLTFLTISSLSHTLPIMHILQMRHIFTDRGFVGLSHFAVDRVLGATHTLRLDPMLLPPEDGGGVCV